MLIQIPPNSPARVGINIAIILATIIALRLGQQFFIPVIIALLLAAVLAPAALWLHRVLRIPWTPACLVVIIGLILVNVLLMGVFAIAGARMVQQVAVIEKDFPKSYKDFRTKLERISPWPLDEELLPPSEQVTSVDDIPAYKYVVEATPKMLGTIVSYGSSWAWQWILILFILLFLMLEGRMLTRRVVEIFGPSEETRAKAGAVLHDMAKSVRTYLVWRTIINFGLAIVVGLVYQIAELRQPWTWAILLAILNYVPYLGPLVAGVPPFIDALLFNQEIALLITVVYAFIIIVEGYLIVPLLMGRSMDLNATTVMLACLFWELVWGIMGLFLAMPIMAGVRAICLHVPGWRPWANLMSTDEGAPQPVTTAEIQGMLPEDNGQAGAPPTMRRNQPK